MLFWRSHGQDGLSFLGNSCKNMWWANTFWYIEALLTRRAAVPPLGFFPPVFGGCYWKPWLQALIVYFVLPFFSWRPSHDNAVGMTDKAGQKFHRSTAKLPRRSMSYTANYSSVCQTEACKNAFVCTLNNVQSNLKGQFTNFIYNCIKDLLVMRSTTVCENSNPLKAYQQSHNLSPTLSKVFMCRQPQSKSCILCIHHPTWTPPYNFLWFVI